MAGPEIAVVGGGLGGLTLARVLHVHGLRATVYEREPDRAGRGQGGMLDLHADSGQRAVEAAGLTAGFARIARPEGEDLVLLEPDGTELLRQTAPAGAASERPEVDRSALRDLLLDSLPRDAVRWGRAYEGAEPRPGGGWTLRFADGSTAGADLLVGADGAWSRVRTLLTGTRPAHLGQNTVELGIPDADRTHPGLAAVVGRGNWWVVGPDRSLSAQRNGDGRIRVYLGFRTPAGWLDTCGIPFEDPAAARGVLRELFADWHPVCGELIGACDDAVLPRALAVLPVGLRWDAGPGVTLLGDAAHLMPPVGLGANTAMVDGAELARELAARPDDLDAAVRAYERGMFERGAAAAAESARIHGMMADLGARGLIELLQPA